MEFVQELGLLLPLFLLGLVLFLTLKFLQELVVFNISLRETFLDQDLVDSYNYKLILYRNTSFQELSFSLMVNEPYPENLLSSVHHNDVEAGLVGALSQLQHPRSGLFGPG